MNEYGAAGMGASHEYLEFASSNNRLPRDAWASITIHFDCDGY